MARYFGKRSLESITKQREEINESISNLRKEIKQIKNSKNFKLSEGEQEYYNSHNKIIEEGKAPLSRAMKPYKNEKAYAISWKKIQIDLYKDILVQLVCQEKGHVEKSSHIASGPGGTRVYANCSRCGMMYDRSLTSKESEDFYKFMNTPFTI